MAPLSGSQAETAARRRAALSSAMAKGKRYSTGPKNRRLPPSHRRRSDTTTTGGGGGGGSSSSSLDTSAIGLPVIDSSTGSSFTLTGYRGSRKSSIYGTDDTNTIASTNAVLATAADGVDVESDDDSDDGLSDTESVSSDDSDSDDGSSSNDGSSNRNAAQQFSSDVSLTLSPTPTPTPTTVIVTTATTVTTGPDTVVTSFVPLITGGYTEYSATTMTASATSYYSTASATSSMAHGDYNHHHDLDNGNSTIPTNKDKDSDDDIDTATTTLNPTTERALISVGSIGAVIVVSFLFWVVFRIVQRQRSRLKRDSGDGGGGGALPSSSASASREWAGPLAGLARLPGDAYGRVAHHVPFLSRQRKAWQTLEETSTAAATPPMAQRGLGLGPSAMPDVASARLDKDGEINALALPTDTGTLPSVPAQAYYGNTNDSNAGGISGLVRSDSRVSGYPYSSFEAQAAVAARFVAGEGAATTITTATAAAAAAANDPDDVANTIGTYTDTMRSRMPDPYYNQSALARQPSDAYDPAQRQVNRVSELSSLSSGFGDGEIIVPSAGRPPVAVASTDAAGLLAVPPPPPIPADRDSAAIGRFSWMRRSHVSRDRETVYTESSEDQPARFRSVNSWVNQQTGRIRRAQASSRDDNGSDGAAAVAAAAAAAAAARGDDDNPMYMVPGIPHPLPQEERLTMMVDDEEVPRRPDTVPGIGPA